METKLWSAALRLEGLEECSLLLAVVWVWARAETESKHETTEVHTSQTTRADAHKPISCLGLFVGCVTKLVLSSAHFQKFQTARSWHVTLIARAWVPEFRAYVANLIRHLLRPSATCRKLFPLFFPFIFIFNSFVVINLRTFFNIIIFYSSPTSRNDKFRSFFYEYLLFATFSNAAKTI